MVEDDSSVSVSRAFSKLDDETLVRYLEKHLINVPYSWPRQRLLAMVRCHFDTSAYPEELEAAAGLSYTAFDEEFEKQEVEKEEQVERVEIPQKRVKRKRDPPSSEAGNLTLFTQHEMSEEFALPGRFRDYKRSLFQSLDEDHQRYIESSELHMEIASRLPHRISIREFAIRLLLLCFHFCVRDGRTPSFWRRLRVLRVRQCVGEETWHLYSPKVGIRVFYLVRANTDISEAVKRAVCEVTRNDDSDENEDESEADEKPFFDDEL